MVPVLGAEFVDLRSGPLIKLGETFGRDEIGFETRGAGLLSLVLICLLIESFFRRSIILFPFIFPESREDWPFGFERFGSMETFEAIDSLFLFPSLS